MTTARVYNTSPLRLMLDTAGHGIDPATWRTANTSDPVTAQLIAAGQLIVAPAPAAPASKPPAITITSTDEPDPAPAGKPGRKKESI